jgi:hypothetical protein
MQSVMMMSFICSCRSGVGVLRTGPVAAGVLVYSSVSICRNVHCELPQCIVNVRMWVGGCNLGLPLLLFAVVTLPSRSTTPVVAGCQWVGCSLVSRLPIRSRAVTGVSHRVCVCLGPVLASHAPSPPAAAAATCSGRGLVPIAGWSYGGVGPERGLLGRKKGVV